MRSSLVLLIAIAVVVSGCAGDAAPTSAAPPSASVAAPDEIVEGAGSIAGTVVDDESRQLVGATVALLELNLQVASNEDGRFEFRNLPPATYRLAAQKLGYASVARSVVVEPGEAATLTLTMPAIAIEEAYQETFGPFAGFFECRASWYGHGYTGTCTTVCPSGCVDAGATAGIYKLDRAILKFNLTSDDVASVVGDMRWTPSAYGTSDKMRFAFSHEKRTGSHWWCSGEGKAPLGFVWHAEGDSVCANVGGAGKPATPVMADNPMRVYANVPFATTSSPLNLAYQQKFEMMATVFYGDPAPEGYTALPDN